MKAILHIFRKETRELFRDKRVVSNAFIGPVVLIFVILMLFGFLSSALRKPKASVLYVVAREQLPQGLASALASGSASQIKLVRSISDGEALVRDGKANLVIRFPENMEAKAATGNAKILAIFNPDEPASEIALQSFKGLVGQLNKTAAQKIVEAKGIPKGLLEPIQIEEKNASSGKGLGASMLVGLLPYLIVIWAFYGGMGSVSDLVAGEKERGTLETLLISPVSRTQIALGKFLALSLVCLLSSLSSLLGVILVATLRLPLTKNLFPEGIHLSVLSILSILAVLLPLVAFFSGLLLTVSSYAKNMRESQTYLALLSIVILMPAMFSQFISYTDFGKSRWVNVMPVLNSASSIRDALLGRIDPIGLAACVSISLAIAAVSMWLVVVMFKREQILTRI